MTFTDWFNETKEMVKRDGVEGAKESLYRLYLGGGRRFTTRFSGDGEDVFQEEWDILVILDGCRYDVMSEVANEYLYIGEVEKRTSVASWSGEWIDKTLAGRNSKAKYITGNPFSEEYLEDFSGDVDEMWRRYWSREDGTILPTPITNEVVKSHRENPEKKIIAHYMQPHHPFVGVELDGDFGFQVEDFGDRGDIHNIWKRVRKGDISKNEVVSAYKDNLRFILDHLEILVENVDAKVVLTADHGNAFGEKWFYGHQVGIRTKEVCQVPWCEIDAKDSGEYEVQDIEEGIDVSTQDRLESLGYL